MDKIIAREYSPEQTDFRIYFDDDCLTNKSGDNCAVYIVSKDRHGMFGFNIEEYKDIQQQAQRIIDEYDGGDGIGSQGYQYTSLGELLHHNGVLNNIHNTKKIHAYKRWIEDWHDASDTECVAAYLEITTGVEWKTQSFCGYSQGDYCEVVYCPEHYKNGVDEIGKMWLGCATEFDIDGCGGYFVTDTIRWREDDNLVKLLAEYAGCKPEELEVQLYIGDHKVNDYKTLTIKTA